MKDLNSRDRAVVCTAHRVQPWGAGLLSAAGRVSSVAVTLKDAWKRKQEVEGRRRHPPPDHRLREGFTAAPGRGWRVAKYQEPRRGGRCPPLRLQSSPVPRSSGRCRVPPTSFSCPVVRPGTQDRAEQGRLEQAPCLALPRWVKRSVRRH